MLMMVVMKKKKKKMMMMMTTTTNDDDDDDDDHDESSEKLQFFSESSVEIMIGDERTDVYSPGGSFANTDGAVSSLSASTPKFSVSDNINSYNSTNSSLSSSCNTNSSK